MRQLALWSSALLLFVVSFGAIYLSFRSSTPALRGAVGGGFFLCIALLLLWKDLALGSIPKEEFKIGSAGFAKRALERFPVVEQYMAPMLAAELPSNATADASTQVCQAGTPHRGRSGLRPDRDCCDRSSNRAA